MFPMRSFAQRSKNELKPWLKEQWCIPSKAEAAFAYNMENVLEVYKRR